MKVCLLVNFLFLLYQASLTERERGVFWSVQRPETFTMVNKKETEGSIQKTELFSKGIYHDISDLTESGSLIQ